MDEGSQAAALLLAAQRRSGLTASQWATRAGVSRSLLHGYLAGKHQPSLPQLERLLQAAGQTLHVEIRPAQAWRDPGSPAKARRSREERGRALLDVLSVADAIPVRRRTALRYPPLRDLVKH